MTQATGEIELSKATLEMFAEMVTALDEYDTGGGDAIVQAIMGATDLDSYNSIFGGERGFPLDVEMKVWGVKYAKSEFAAGLPFYLVADCQRVDNGERRDYTIGAMVPVATLVRAAFLGQLPVIGVAYESKEATKGGYHPVNWRMLALSPAKAKAK